jgi:phosphopantetheine adenylyltransferase
MEYGKYIIIETDLGHEVAICFDPLLGHNEIVRTSTKVVAAGFFTVGSNPTKNDSKDISVSTFGKSTTLNKETREADAALIKRVLRKENKW